MGARGGRGRGEVLIPNEASVASIIKLGGSSLIEIEVCDNEGLEIIMMPIYILEVLYGDHCDLQVERLPLRRLWRGHG